MALDLGADLGGRDRSAGGRAVIAPRWSTGYGHNNPGYHWLCAVVLFLLCLLEIQVGVQRRSESLVNLGITFIALIIIATYVSLFGSMARTGLMFLVGGVFLIVFGIYLEKKRRALMQQMKSPSN